MSVPKLNVDLVANLAILATCTVVGGAVIHRYYLSSERSPAAVTQLKTGDRAETLPGVSYQDASATLVLHVRSTCQYCTESMEFYRRARQAIKRSERARLVVVSAEPREILQRYLDEHGVEPDLIISAPENPKPTPTLVLVDGQGVVRDSWLGLQKPDGEQRLFDQVAGS